MRYLPISVLILTMTHLGATPLTLPFGAADPQLGVYADGDYLRGPRGLAWDGQAWLVADGYKARAAWYDGKGRFMKSVPLDGISPRTVGFLWNEDRTLVTFNDQSLSRWSEQGTSLGSVGLGLALPDLVGAESSQAYAVFSENSGGSTLVWNRDFSQAHRYSLTTGARVQAALQDSRNRYWLIDGQTQAKTFHWKASLPAGSFWAGARADGLSLWIEKAPNEFHLRWISSAGELEYETVVIDIGPDPVWGVDPQLAFVWGKTTTQGFMVDRVSLPSE